MRSVAPHPSRFKKSSRVAIVGFCQSSRDLCPYDDPSIEVWGLNKGGIFMPRADRWFEMHGPGIYKWAIRRPHKHVEWLRDFPGPVYMHTADPEIPNTVEYPLQAVAEDIGEGLFRIDHTAALTSFSIEPYLSSSVAYEIALAIHEGYEEIALYGIDLNTQGEYAWQKAGVEHLLGIAAGRGIRVILPAVCPLLRGPLYGRGYLKPEGESITVSQYETRLDAVRKEKAQAHQELLKLSGAATELKYMIDQCPSGVLAEKLSDRLKQVSGAAGQFEAKLHQLDGQEREIVYWISTTPEGQPGDQAIAQLDARYPDRPADEGPDPWVAEAVDEAGLATLTA